MPEPPYAPGNLSQLLADYKRIRALADIGLLYCSNEYDRERYTELREISTRLLAAGIGTTTTSVDHILHTPPDYPTPKVDVRAFIRSADDKVLLVRESIDGRWTLPGGWADIGCTPTEMVVRECREEAGIEVQPGRLLAIFDKRQHPHPPEPFYVYKLIFECTVTAGPPTPGHDVLDVGYFSIDDLPPLSEVRILRSQLETLFRLVKSNQLVPMVD